MPYKQTVTGSNPVSPTINYMPRFCVAFLYRAFSSAGEHFLHTEGVIGSIPVTPTIEFKAEVMPRLFYCTAIVDKNPDGVVIYYAFCSMGQPAAENTTKDEEDAG